jgi:glycosyltransferase involved in cell wall biosynthesis
MEDALSRTAGAESFDLVQLDHINLAAYVPLLNTHMPNTPVILNWHNIESEAMRRFAAQSRSLPKRAYASITAARLAALEKDLLSTAFGHLVCSDRERNQLQELVPRARIAVIENGVDTEFMSPSVEQEHRHRLLFVGLMRYYANVDAITWFADSLWPAIHRTFPGWRLTIVGADPAPPVIALRDRPGIEVTGTVPDLRPYYRQAIASVVPLRTGGGTRLKILEAMAAGVPVISTKIGAEGLAITPGENILIADREQDWLPALAEISNHDRWRSLAEAGLLLTRTRYDWRLLEETLYRTCAEWLAEVQ